MLVACPRCCVHTKKADPLCAHCGEPLRDGIGHIAKTAAAMVLGLTVTGFQPHSGGEPVPEYGVPAVPNIAEAWKNGQYDVACPGMEKLAVTSPSGSTHYNAGVCYQTWAQHTPPDGKLPHLEKALDQFERALPFEEKKGDAVRVAAIHQRVGEIEAEIIKLEGGEAQPRPNEPPPTPVYGVAPAPRHRGCGCEMPAPGSTTPFAYGALAVAMLAFRRRRRR